MPILTTVGSAERNQVSEEAVPGDWTSHSTSVTSAGPVATVAGPAVIDGTSVHLEGTDSSAAHQQVRRTHHAKPSLLR